jgi:hypothetical protein
MNPNSTMPMQEEVFASERLSWLAMQDNNMIDNPYQNSHIMRNWNRSFNNLQERRSIDSVTERHDVNKNYPLPQEVSQSLVLHDMPLYYRNTEDKTRPYTSQYNNRSSNVAFGANYPG